MTLRAAVIGLGVGERHVAAYQALAGVEVTLVCDHDAEHARVVAARHGVARWTTDAVEVTTAADVDVISVASHDADHVEQAVSALDHGKHVMVEKPIALDRAGAQRVREAHARSGKLLTSNLILRAAPRFQRVRELVQSGRLGEVFLLEGDYLHHIEHKITEGWRGRTPDYSVIHGGGIHLIDLMRWILDDEVVEVTGMGTGLATRDTAWTSHDTTVNVLRFSRGAIAKTVTTFVPQRPKFHHLAVYGTMGTFVNGTPDGTLWWGTDPSDAEPVTDDYPPRDKGDLLGDFVAAIRQGREPLVSASDVLAVMDICLAAERSIVQGGPVVLRPPT